MSVEKSGLWIPDFKQLIIQVRTHILFSRLHTHVRQLSGCELQSRQHVLQCRAAPPGAPNLLVLSSLLSFQVVNSGGDVEPKQFDIMMGAGTHTHLAEPAGRLTVEAITSATYLWPYSCCDRLVNSTHLVVLA